jgi:hypothetical protein
MADDDKLDSAESNYVIVARDYADIAHLENPSVIERILSGSRTEKVAYVSALLTSGLSKYALAGPRVALAAMAVEALTDFGKEVSEWIRDHKIPEDFSGRPSGYQTWVELLQEIDSNPVDADRLRAMKAMFLAANRVDVTDGESILAYQLFQIARMLKSGQLLLLSACYAVFRSGNFQRNETIPAATWASKMANKVGHGLKSLVEQDEKILIGSGLLNLRRNMELQVSEYDARLTDLGIKFCQNVEEYQVATGGESPATGD